MESDSIDCKKNNSGHVWPINRRGKAKLNSSGDFKSDAVSLKSADDSILTGDYSEINDTEVGSRKDAVILREKLDGVVFRNKNRPALDSNIYKIATNLISAKEQSVEIPEPPESSIERLTEDEALDKIDDINSKRQHPLVNTRALPKEATTYELETFDKNALVIFNHKKVDGLEDRLGTEKDVEALTTTFKNFGFEVTSYDNLGKAALFRKLKKFSRQDFTDYGCIAVAILTHGDKDGKLRAKDDDYNEVDVINYFKEASKPTLVSKPKIFIIQACRGAKISTGDPFLQSRHVSKDLDAKDMEPYYILPLESDLLILHSSYPGYASHRDDKDGSWFVQTLCLQIDTLSLTHDLDLESIITEVKRAVAINMEDERFNKVTGKLQVNKQMPIMTSTLIRKLYLKKVGDRALGESYGDKSKLRCESRLAHYSLPRTLWHAQFGPCACSLEHFTYMTDCLRHFVEDNPNDKMAQEMLKLADTYEDNDKFNKCKDKLCEVISQHFTDKAQDSQFYKYLHFVPAERKVTKSKNAQNESSMLLKSSFPSLNVCLTGIFAATFVFVLRNVKTK